MNLNLVRQESNFILQPIYLQMVLSLHSDFPSSSVTDNFLPVNVIYAYFKIVLNDNYI